MNRLGVLVDLSHVSDSTFWDVLASSQAPPIASHSSARTLVDNVRNLSDDMIRAVAERNGVVLVNYFDLVVNRGLTRDIMSEAYQRLSASGDRHLWRLWDVLYQIRSELGIPRATVSDVIDHIDHIARLVGTDYVGLGSDFDGATMPLGLDDVGRLPWITFGLLERGYTEEDLYKILGGNVLRVLDEADEVALRLQSK
jgi:membrane dipeptidase